MDLLPAGGGEMHSGVMMVCLLEGFDEMGCLWGLDRTGAHLGEGVRALEWKGHGWWD